MALGKQWCCRSYSLAFKGSTIRGDRALVDARPRPRGRPLFGAPKPPFQARLGEPYAAGSRVDGSGLSVPQHTRESTPRTVTALRSFFDRRYELHHADSSGMRCGGLTTVASGFRQS
jgi:hypothetical protein